MEEEKLGISQEEQEKKLADEFILAMAGMSLPHEKVKENHPELNKEREKKPYVPFAKAKVVRKKI